MRGIGGKHRERPFVIGEKMPGAATHPGAKLLVWTAYSMSLPSASRTASASCPTTTTMRSTPAARQDSMIWRAIGRPHIGWAFRQPALHTDCCLPAATMSADLLCSSFITYHSSPASTVSFPATENISRARIRTSISRTKICCPAIRRPGNALAYYDRSA